ncbi:MAG: WcaI family glycosyltransferase [Candidatus Limnocylindrales bacterium]
MAERGAAPRILIYSMYYWPEESGNAPYSTGIAEHLAANGMEVTVVAGMPHYPAWEVDARYRGRWRQTEQRAGVRIERFRHHIPRRQSAARRAVYEASFLAHASMRGQGQRPDAVLGVIPSMSGGVLARIAAARAGAAYGIIVQDIMSAAAAQSGITGGRRAAAVTGSIERWALRRATVVAPVAAAFIPILAGMGVEARRIVHLPNWAHLPPPARDRQDVRTELGWRGDEVIALHAGNMGLKQGLEQIIDAARSAMAVDPRLRFVLMGDGNQRAHLLELADGLTNVTFAPFVERERLVDVLAAADVLLLSERSTVRDMSLPSKLTSYLAAGRPVIAAVDPAGASASEVRRADAGVVVRAGDARSLVRAIIDLVADPAEIQRLGENSRRYAETTLGSVASLATASAIVDRLLQSTIQRRRTDPSA